MAHSKESISNNTQAVVSALEKQITVYQGAIAALTEAAQKCQNAKNAVLMMATSADEVQPLDLRTHAVEVPAARGREGFIKNLAEKISAGAAQ